MCPSTRRSFKICWMSWNVRGNPENAYGMNLKGQIVALVLPILLTSCASYGPYHPDSSAEPFNSVRGPTDGHYKLAFIEFGDQGSVLDTSQRTAALEVIHEAERPSTQANITTVTRIASAATPTITLMKSAPRRETKFGGGGNLFLPETIGNPFGSCAYQRRSFGATADCGAITPSPWWQLFSAFSFR